MNHKYKSSLVKKIYLYYVLFFVIPFLVLNFAIISISGNTYKSDMKALKTEYVTNLKNYIDTHFAEINLTAGKLAENIDVYNFSSSSPARDYSSYIYDAKQVINAIDTYMKYKTTYFSVFLYYPNQRCILSGTSLYSLEDFSQAFLRGTNLSLEEIENLLFNYSEQIISLQESSPDSVMLVKPLFSQNSQASATMISLININNIINSYNTLNSHNIFTPESNELYTTIVDSENNILYKLGTLPKHISFDTLPDSQYNKTISVGKNYYLLRQKSNLHSLNYLCVFPTENVSNNFEYMQLLISLAVLVVGILYLVASYKLSAKMFSPFNALVNADPQNNALSFRIQSFSQIQNFIFDLVNSNKDLKTIVEKQQQTITTNMFNQLLQNSSDLTEESFSTMFDCYDMKFIYSNYQAIVISFSESDQDKSSMLRFSLLAAIQDLSSREGIVHFVIPMLTSNVVIVLNHGYDEFFIQDHLSHLISNLDLKNDTVTIGVGRNVKSLNSFSKSYEDALFSLKLSDKNKCHYLNAAQKRLAGDIYFTKEEREFLQKALLCGDSNSVSDFFDRCYEVLFEKNILTAGIYAYICYSLADLLEDSVVRLNILCEETEEYIFQTEQTLSSRNYNESFNIIKNNYISLCNYIQNKKSNSNITLMENIYAYINSHYMDPDISLKQISSEVYVSYNYLCKFFKEQTGMLFLDYLHTMRIDKSKELLKNTNKAINDIAQSVGYLSSISYIRKFKQLTGMTPGEYRKTV